MFPANLWLRRQKLAHQPLIVSDLDYHTVLKEAKFTWSSPCVNLLWCFTPMREAVDSASDIFPHYDCQMLNIALHWRCGLQYLHGPFCKGFVEDIVHTRPGEAAHFRMKWNESIITNSTNCLDFATLPIELRVLILGSERTTWIVTANPNDMPKTRGAQLALSLLWSLLARILVRLKSVVHCGRIFKICS